MAEINALAALDTVRQRLIEAGVPQAELEAVLARGGQVWDTDQLRADFEVKGFMAPFVVVKRKSDGMVGSLMFTHSPRFYYGWTEDQ